jgi:hypothetical protein
MTCEACNGSQDSKPIKFFWKDKVFCMENDDELGNLMVREHLGLTIPEEITDFEVCLDCSELISGTPEDLPKYENLIDQILKDIVATRAEAIAMDSEEELKEMLK